MSLTPGPASWPREDDAETRLLHVDPATGSFDDARMQDLPELLRAGDLLVVNDVGTLPASLIGTSRYGPIEVRLAGPPASPGGPWPAVLFGAGSWRERTEDRPAPPPLVAGDPIVFEEVPPSESRALSALVVSVSDVSPRLVGLRFDREGAALWSALYRHGRPVQYSYLRGPLALWHIQTPYGARPWAVEMPSAGRPLRLPLLRALRKAGVALASVSHAAGLSSTGDPALDAALPFPEPTDIPLSTVEAVLIAMRSGGRVVAAGTSVVRALEGRTAERPGSLPPGPGLTRLRVGPGYSRRIVDGVLTGLHQPGESHFEMLQAFAPRVLLEHAIDHAAREGYRSHEFGDLSLILAA